MLPLCHGTKARFCLMISINQVWHWMCASLSCSLSARESVTSNLLQSSTFSINRLWRNNIFAVYKLQKLSLYRLNPSVDNSVKWQSSHDDVIKWKHFPRYWSVVQGQWRGALIFSLFRSWTKDWINARDAGDLIRHRAHYDVTVMPIVNTSRRVNTMQYTNVNMC